VDDAGVNTADGVVSPSREDPVVAAASVAFGGPAGRRALPGRGGWWTVARVLVVASMVVLAVGVVQKQHCRSNGWSTPDMFFHACYSDLPVVYEQTGLATGDAPYAVASHGHYLEQPVLTGLTMWGVAKLVPGGSRVAQDRWYFDLWVIVVAMCLAALVLVTVASARGRPWDAAHVALSPLLIPLALVSPDLLGVALASAGLLAWGRKQPAVAGVLLGLAISARTYPVLLVLVLGLLAARAGRVREWWVTVGWAVLAAAVVVVPWFLANPDGVTAAYDSWRTSGAGYGSPWLIPGIWGPSASIRHHQLPGFLLASLSPASVTRFAVLGWVVALLAGAVLALAAPRRPRVAQVALVVVGIVLLTGKSFPVQSSLWLVPLVALALPRWREHLAWFVAEALYFVAVWLYAASISTPTRGLPGRGYVWLLVLRLVLVGMLVVQTFRAAWRPERDPVRNPDPDAVLGPRGDGVRSEAAPGGGRPYVDDPLGGPLDGAPDRLIVRLS
jgi:uncharacterized membrane protein